MHLISKDAASLSGPMEVLQGRCPSGGPSMRTCVRHGVATFTITRSDASKPWVVESREHRTVETEGWRRHESPAEEPSRRRLVTRGSHHEISSASPRGGRCRSDPTAGDRRRRRLLCASCPAEADDAFGDEAVAGVSAGRPGGAIALGSGRRAPLEHVGDSSMVAADDASPDVHARNPGGSPKNDPPGVGVRAIGRGWLGSSVRDARARRERSRCYRSHGDRPR
jgi:hypothetical protein